MLKKWVKPFVEIGDLTFDMLRNLHYEDDCFVCGAKVTVDFVKKSHLNGSVFTEGVCSKCGKPMMPLPGLLKWQLKEFKK